MEANDIHLPKTVGHWSRPDSPQLIDSENIFRYMDGAGELYLGYRFRGLQVFEYGSTTRDSILVEVYFMETSDEAFGLLSMDWGGEPVLLGDAEAHAAPPSSVSWQRALYGAGLLRIWSDTVYARVMASNETPSARLAVLALGRAIAENRKNPPAPELVNRLPRRVGSNWKLRTDRLTFFRSYLVLNAVYYLSHENILDLDLTTEAVAAPYESVSGGSGSRRSQFLVVKYPNSDRALKALHHFHDAYLPEHKKQFAADSALALPSFFKLEDGWLGYTVFGNHIALVFECPDSKSVRMILRENEVEIRK